MDHNSQRSDGYFSVLDNFASELGSTLEDLATNYEENQTYPKEDSGSYTGSQYSSRSQSIMSTDSGSVMDDLGKRLAKPLFFYNPVYSMVYKDATPPQIKRPTLIPISQLNGNKTPENNDVRHRKGSAGKIAHKKKSPHGFLSKLTAGIRRQSQPKLVLDESQSESSSNRVSVASIGDHVADATNHKVDETPPVVKRHQRDSGIVESRQSTGNEMKSIKTPPTKSPRTSRIIMDNVVIQPNIAESPVDVNNAQPLAKPVPKQRTKTSPVFTNENKTSSADALSTVDSNKKTLITPETAEISGSMNSLDSSFSEDTFPSDVDVKTMADVITEVSKEEPESLQNKNKTEMDSDMKEEFVETPGLLKRNKTLRWTGTRKAPALIREFTRRQKLKSSDLGSPSKEVESLTRKPKVVYNSRSRSCTPSQQTTSFGMGDDDDLPDSASQDADVSSSENSDATSSAVADQVNSSNKDNLVEPKKEGASNRDSAFIVLSSLLPPAPKLRRTQSSKVRAYLQKMGNNVNNALGYAVTQFVDQTLKNKENRPLVLLHDIRSFLTDIKRYLISNPHIGLVRKIQKIVNKSTMVDVEGAVDDALDRLVLYPLHDLVYRCLVVDYTRSGQLTLMQEAINLAKKKTKKELGIRDTLIPPDHEVLETIKSHFIQLQRTYSPYFKLKELLAAVTKIYQNTQDLNMDDRSARKIGADDFLPLLVYAIVHCDFIAADIEAQYIDGLLDPALLLGEGGYYLTTLISAIQVVFSIKRKEAALPNISDLQGFLKVGISSEAPKEGGTADRDKKSADDEVILHKTLHVPPAMTSRNLCQMITKKFHVSVPENYCLHVVVNGVAHALESNECPQLVKMDLLTQFPPSSFYFSFQKRDSSSKILDQLSGVNPVVKQTDDLLVAVAHSDTQAVETNASANKEAKEMEQNLDEDIHAPQQNEHDNEENYTHSEDKIVNELSSDENDDSNKLSQHEDEGGFISTTQPPTDYNVSHHERPLSDASIEDLRESLDSAERHFSEVITDLANIPEISVTQTQDEIGSLLEDDRKDVESLRSSNASSIDDVFLNNTGIRKRHSCIARESVSSLAEWFETRSGQASPALSNSSK